MSAGESDGGDEEEAAVGAAESGDAAAGSSGSGAALTKTALKKAKKEEKKRQEEEKQRAEEEAKKKADEAEKKKQKKAAKKQAGGGAGGGAGAGAAAAADSGSGDTAGESASTSSTAAPPQSKEDLAGWEVQKSDKPPSNKSSSLKGAQTAGAKPSSSRKRDDGESKESEAASASASSSASAGSEVYEEMYIPFKHHAQLIGSKGATLQQLQSGSGCKIDMPKKDSGSTKVQLTGSAEAVQAARGAIDSLISKGYSTLTHPGFVHDDVTVEERQLGLIIGPSGAYIKAIQSKTATRISLPDKEADGAGAGSGGSKKVVIVGKKEDVRSARLAIRELLADGFSPLTHDGFVKREVSFPKDRLHQLIGSKGQTIKSIQGNSKARINIPDRSAGAGGEQDVKVSVIGTPEAVAQAEKEIARLLIPVQVVEEEAEEEYRDGTWSEAGPTEDELWE